MNRTASLPVLGNSISPSQSLSPLDPSPVPAALREAVWQAALQLQAHLDQEESIVYQVEDLQFVLTRWLEHSIESLVEDALFHTVEGDRAYAFNRPAFERYLKRIQPIQAEHSTSDQTIAA